MSWRYACSDGYDALFAAGALGLTLALALSLLTGAGPRRNRV